MRDAPPDRVDTDVLVIGAGPAGSAAALKLARQGLRVVLADRARFPRDKACGDALIPDALAALATLGLDQEVLPRARRLSGLVITAPGGRRVRVQGRCAMVPRRVLDDVLRQAAVRAGACWMAPARAVGPLEEGARLRGAVLQAGADQAPVRVSAHWTILATGGASADLLDAFGVLERQAPSAMAARLYLQVPASLAASFNELHISFERDLSPGYGWVFPGPDDTFNIGVGVFGYTRHPPGRMNLRVLLDRFCAAYAPARALLAASTSSVTPLLGAPLRTGLSGARLGRPGLLVAGEAAGTTYSLTGEGIGKALATGMAAADAIAQAAACGEMLAPCHDAYRRRVESDFAGRFRAYSLAQHYVAYPAVADYLAWRARKDGFVRQTLEALFNEATDARTLFSLSGLVRALLG